MLVSYCVCVCVHFSGIQRDVGVGFKVTRQVGSREDFVVEENFLQAEVWGQFCAVRPLKILQLEDLGLKRRDATNSRSRRRGGWPAEQWQDWAAGRRRWRLRGHLERKGWALGILPPWSSPVCSLQHAVGVGSAAAEELQMLLCRPAGEETRRAAGLLGCSGRAG